MGKRMVAQFLGGIFVYVHGEDSPTQEEWDSAMALRTQHESEITGILIVSEGGGPSLSQRRQDTELWGRADTPPAACMTSSPVVRGILTALKWVRPSEICILGMGEYDKALDHLSIGGGMRQTIKTAVKRAYQKIQ